MPRSPRIVLEGYDLIEVSNRTVHSRFLLKPSPELNAIIHGALGRAQKKYGVKVHAYVFMSNHYHLLISPCDSLRMARFVGYFQSKIAKEVGRLYGWKDKLWSRRFDHIPIPQDEDTQVARLQYLFENSCKEDLVYSPLEWPGASSLSALASGVMHVTGIWPDRTAQWWANQRAEVMEESNFHCSETVELSPLPCWSHLAPESYSKRVLQIAQQIERDTRERHRISKTRPAGVRRVRRQHPHSRPSRTKRSSKPRVHATTHRARREFWSAFQAVVAAYRLAVAKLRQGDSEAVFPPGSFPPSLPFVPT